MGYKEFKEKCEKKGHAFCCKCIPISRGPREHSPGKDVNVTDAKFTVRCPDCDATCIVTGKWDNPTG